ncbi:MAG: gamma-glutamyl-gamma-aminobutyrate hydrolase family protein [Patescibacteria group bacterium]
MKKIICIIDCGTSGLEKIIWNVTESGNIYKVLKLDEIEGANFNLFAGIIITGAPILLTEVNQDEFVKRFDFLRSINIPVLGICLGHQIMGLVYDAEINITDRIEKKEKIEILVQDKLFAYVENFSEFQELHSEYISLPRDFDLLATSASCVNEAMKHKTKMLYSTQFHPELSGDPGKTLLRNFIEMC